MTKTSIMNVQGIEIALTTINEEDFICITDIVKAKGGDARAADIIKNWIRNRSTIEFLGTWETLYNPNFKVVEFDHFRKEAGLPTFTMSVSNWIEKTGAIGIVSKAGRYGGTYAHKDIAFEFCSAISPMFKLYVIKEYQRLVELERSELALSWNVKRLLSKANYHIHTDAIKNVILPKLNISQMKQGLVYASEADLLNMVLFGCTAKQWQEANPELAKTMNIRDTATINQLIVLSNIESLNAELIKQGISKEDRFAILRRTAEEQLAVLISRNAEQNFAKLASEDPKLIK
ncbi:MAG: KilA-N domain-containing protein [Bacteroidales bacterium]|nr:KilA-N domain-containing protein [Bacteroidales bacterium]